MVRIVRTPDGDVLLDETGKHNGRGAYLCRQRRCWESALKQHRLENTLRISLPDEIQRRLIAFMNQLPESLSESLEGRGAAAQKANERGLDQYE